ncbi:hypothetical protein AB0M43_23745 [Longispora sp. NPDC051575]|uniref:hypothetical protein n=1 Tax=Longispora sp. NPDC051575 TaxID=3154943 RepID=UPI00342BB00E
MTPVRRALRLAVVALLLAGCAAPHRPARTRPSPTPDRSPTTAPAQPTPAPGPPLDNTQDKGVAAPPAPRAVAVADAYVRAWARPDLPAEQWLAGVRPLAIPAYGALLVTVTPARVPARTVTGPPVTVSSTSLVCVFDVPTDVGPMRVTVIRDGDLWQVASLIRSTP